MLTLMVRRRNILFGLIGFITLGGLIYFCWQQSHVVQAVFMEESAMPPFEAAPTAVSPVSAAASSSLIPDVANKETFFAEFRMERDRLRSQQMEFYREIVHGPDASVEMREEAQKLLFALVRDLENELKVENLLFAQGYSEAVIFLQPQAVTVVLAGITPEMVPLSAVTHLVSQTLGCKEESVTIITRP